MRTTHLIRIALTCAICGLTSLASGQTRTLRVVTYNIEADINGVTAPRPGLIAPPGDTNNIQTGGVLEGIGEEMVGNDPAQPLDILLLQETTSNPATVSPIVNGLNVFYQSPSMYTFSHYQATESGGYTASGNGPNALVFNTETVQLIAAVPVDPPGGTAALGSSSGEYREVMRYEFAPAGVSPAASNEFYIYVSHYKSGTTSADLISRTGEAQIIRNDESTYLPADARVLYAGDFNVTTSGEVSYQTILSNTAPDGIQQGQGVDPLNVTGATGINWGTFTSNTNILATETESAIDLRYRDDLLIMTSNIYYGSPGGLKYVAGTCHTFGNNGTTAYYGSVNSSSNTSLNNNLAPGCSISAPQLYVDLTDASDHLPVVADYTIPVPAPVVTGMSTDGTNLVLNVFNNVQGGILTVLSSMDLTIPESNWKTLTTNIADTGGITITLSNVVDQAVLARFFILQEK
jgi:endonuclease/exonuclease/phosphatase family metal-dependent hydrolase